MSIGMSIAVIINEYLKKNHNFETLDQRRIVTILFMLKSIYDKRSTILVKSLASLGPIETKKLLKPFAISKLSVTRVSSIRKLISCLVALLPSPKISLN